METAGDSDDQLTMVRVANLSRRFPFAIGILGLVAAVGVMVAWLSGAAATIYPGVGTVMVLNTALCFALTALALILNNPASPRCIALQQALGTCIVLIAGLVGSQYVFSYSLGVDWPTLHRSIADGNPYPGRMSKATVVAFALCGSILFLMHRVHVLWSGLLVQALIITIVFIGVASLAGQLLELHLVFETYLFSQIAIYTAAGFVLSGIAFGLCWRESAWYRSRILIRTDEQRISLIGLAILGVVTSISVIAGFKITQHQTADMAGDRLQHMLKANVNALIFRIQQGTALAQAVASRPVSIEKMGSLNSQPDNPAAIAFMKRVAESFLPLGASAVAYYSPEGKEWIRVGRFTTQPELKVALTARHPSFLMWDRGLVFRTEAPMISAGEIVGTVVVEQPFDTLTKTHIDASELGKTGEIGLCTLRDDRFHCFPQRLVPRVFSVPYSKQLPMSYAVAGQTGLKQTRDYRNQPVISAHGPVGDSGLGMVVKMDTAELYQPIRNQFGATLLLLLSVSAAGALLLYWKLTPLVRELDRSRDTIRAEGEQALRSSEDRYRELFESNPHPMWVFDTETLAFLAVNDAAVSHYGYSREEFLAMTVRDIRAPEDVPRLQDAIAKVGRGEAVTGIWRHRKKNGDTILVEVSPRALKFGGRSAIMLLVQDVTARIQAQEALAEEQEKFRALTEQSLVGAYVIDSGVIMYMNPRAAEIFGYRADEVAGRPARDFVVEDDWPLLDENVRRRLSGEVESAQYTLRGRRKDGAVVMIGGHGTTAIIGGKRIIIGVLQDITDKLRAEETIRDYIARLERGISGTVDAVSKMVELRDPYTAGHEQRVGNLSAAIAAEMGLDDNMQQGLRIAGGVHDIGKIVVPAEMLSKPTRLSPAEFELIKVHAQQGYEVLKGIDFPWPVAEVARQHHERIDGSGYPRGLKGEEILLEARIMAVADVVESMASHRPYRAALGMDKALQEIERGAGTRYDAQAAAACLRLFRDKQYRIPGGDLR